MTVSVVDELFDWAASVALPGGVRTKVTPLREPVGPWMVGVSNGDRSVDVVLKAATPDRRSELKCEVAALEVAYAHGLPVPRIVATDMSGDDGYIAFVITAVRGDTDIPLEPTTERLRDTGAAAAAIHRVALHPTAALPLRVRQMPWVDYSAERRAGESPTTQLLDQVDAYLAVASPSPGDTVLVHGDLWQGNLLYDGDQVVGVIDWEAAGVGNAGIDIGSLRWDAALLFGQYAADEIVVGWESASGRAATDIAYWDLVSGANTPADLTPMVESMTHQGRPDLDGPTLNQRRDDFLRLALGRV